MQQSSAGTLSRIVLSVSIFAAACADNATDPLGPEPVGPDLTPASLAIMAGDGQTADAGAALPGNPAVLVKNAAGLPLSGITVNFTVAGGAGIVEFTTATTNAQGIASAGRWTLGPAAGENLLDATVGALPALRFSATALPPFRIVVRYVASPTPRQQQAVESAVARWQGVINRDVSDVFLGSAAESCFTGQPAVNETVDDIIIFVDFRNIDGAGKILGQAGPCYVRSESLLPIMGSLKLDAADLAQMEGVGTLDDVVLHEIGHVLGIGTIWSDHSLIIGAGTQDPLFTGFNATAAYHDLGGTDPAVPVENTGSSGTREAHWRESVFGNELMTGYISGVPNPISALTIASLLDLGYGANAAVAGTYRLGGTAQSARTAIDLNGREKIHKPRFKVDRRGRPEKIRA
jgi:hypothetical protein